MCTHTRTHKRIMFWCRIMACNQPATAKKLTTVSYKVTYHPLTHIVFRTVISAWVAHIFKSILFSYRHRNVMCPQSTHCFIRLKKKMRCRIRFWVDVFDVHVSVCVCVCFFIYKPTICFRAGFRSTSSGQTRMGDREALLKYVW